MAICFECGKEFIPDDEGHNICTECVECPFCGESRMDGCDCHEKLLGFPENCPSD